jgi:DNA-binding NarL/FixJ family response regulator
MNFPSADRSGSVKPAASPDPTSLKGCTSLSFREKQIVDLVSQAKLNKEIAHELHLTEGTIKEYLNKVFRKLGVKNRTELAVWSLMHPSECRVTTGRLPGVH